MTFCDSAVMNIVSEPYAGKPHVRFDEEGGNPTLTLRYADGMGLYNGYFVPRGMDPRGLKVKLYEQPADWWEIIDLVELSPPPSPAIYGKTSTTSLSIGFSECVEKNGCWMFKAEGELEIAIELYRWDLNEIMRNNSTTTGFSLGRGIDIEISDEVLMSPILQSTVDHEIVHAENLMNLWNTMASEINEISEDKYFSQVECNLWRTVAVELETVFVGETVYDSAIFHLQEGSAMSPYESAFLNTDLSETYNDGLEGALNSVINYYNNN